uniref:Potassium channel domain-containing protein n=1 Tax=Timema cristinae TaxID=61476 RepID=A0A7R9C9D8_TIMCR|nr:unnamed protein product [Timema cristinae]
MKLEVYSIESYGNVTPRTEWGKLATILYAIIGMPLFLLYLSNIGDVLAKSFKWTYAKCFLCKGCTRREIPERHRRLKRVQHSMQIDYNESPPEPSFRSFSIREDWQVRHVIGEDDVVAIRMEQDSRGQDTEDDDSDGGEDSDDEDSENEEGLDEEYDPQTVTVPLTLCLAIMVGYVCFGALLFSKWENWGFLDGSYFCFISLSTIGFGDIVPGDKIYKNDSIDLSFIFCSMYLMLGMALIAMSFNLMQEEVVHKIRTCCRTFKRWYEVLTCIGFPSSLVGIGVLRRLIYGRHVSIHDIIIMAQGRIERAMLMS